MRALVFALILLLSQLQFAPAQEALTQPSLSPEHSKLADVMAKLDHGDAEGAVKLLKPLAEEEPPAAGAFHYLGIAYYRAGKLVLAEQAFAKATQHDPSDIESVQMRGLTLYRLGQPAAAIPYLEKVRQWTPNANADAHYVLGLCYLNAQRYDQARAAFADQFGLKPDSGAAYLMLANMLQHANLPELAGEAAGKALQLAPQLPLAHFTLGEIYLYKSDAAHALEEFQKERDLNPGYPATYDRLGDVLLRLGKFPEAQESLMKAISLDTSSTGPFIQMGKVLIRRNDPQTAVMYLKHAVNMDPNNYITHTLLAQAYRSMGKTDEANEEIEISSKIHSSSELKLETVH